MKIDYQIIKRYLKGKEQKGDKEKILSWFSSLETEENLRKEYYRYWKEDLTDYLDIEDYDQDKVLGKIYHEIKLEESKSQFKNTIIHSIFNTVIKIAAILFIPLLVVTLMNTGDFLSINSDIAYSEIYSPPGTRTMFYLPDGSKGCLNSNSYLKFPVKFKGRSRNLELKGEAYFDVRSNPQKPFIVSTSNINVVARGTSFNVLAFPEDKTYQITLIKGKIDVLEKRNEQTFNLGTLTPNQMCIYDKNSSSYKFEQVDASKIAAWKDGKLIFRNEPFQEVVKKLNRRYNSNIVIKDEKLKIYTYLATFGDETLDEVIGLLKISTPIEVKELTRKQNQDGTFEKRTIELYYKQKN